MGSYRKLAFKIFGEHIGKLMPYFSDLRANIHRAKMQTSVQEYLSMAMLASMITFLASLPVLSFLLGFFVKTFLFSFITAVTLSVFATVATFFFFLYYPQSIIKQKGKELDNYLPFASLYLATVASTKLPLDKTFKLFVKFSEYGQITNEVSAITNDVDAFGIDINTALERAVERTTSKNFREVLWGILSTVRSGGDISIYLKEKSRSLMGEYRRKLYEFSHQLTVYIEVYLTTIVLGAIFFTILTAIMSGIGGTAGNIIILQFFLIFVFLPLISLLFILMIRSASPGGE